MISEEISHMLIYMKKQTNQLELEFGTLKLLGRSDRTPVLVRMPRTLKRELKKICEKQKVSQTDAIILAISEFVKRIEGK